MRNYEKIENGVKMLQSGKWKYKDGEIIGVRGKPIGFVSNKGDGRKQHKTVDVGGNNVYVHLIIYAYFHGIEELKKHETVDHLDGNKFNNRIENLEGCTNEENNKRANPTMLGSSNAKKVKELLNKNVPIKEISEYFGVSTKTIYSIKKGETYKSV